MTDRVYEKFLPHGTTKIARRSTDITARTIDRFLPSGYQFNAYQDGIFIGKETLFWPVESLTPFPDPDGPAEDTTLHGSVPVYSHIFPSTGTLYDRLPPVVMPPSWDPDGYMQAYFAWYAKVGAAGNVCNWQLTGFAVNFGQLLAGNYAEGQTETEAATTVVGDPLIAVNSLQLSVASQRFRFVNSATMSTLFMRLRRVTSASDTLEQNAHLLGVGLRFETRSDADD